MVKPKSKEEYYKLFTEMTDLLFEIAEYDDQDGQKSEYLNNVISTWKLKSSTSRKKNNSTPYSRPNNIQDSVKYCYRCNHELTKDHMKNCPGINSLCIHCNKIALLKVCCGQLGYFPHPPRKF